MAAANRRITARRVVGVFLCLVVGIVGCEMGQTPTGVSPPSEALLAAKNCPDNHLDKALKRLLREKSRGRGLGFFKLPRSNQLNRIPQDPKNRLTRRKVRLGKLLYHETALGVNNVRPEGRETYACASCHHARAGFMANVPQGIAEGGSGFGIAGEARTFHQLYDSNPAVPDCQPIRTPTSMNGAYQALMLWNGQFGGVGDNLGTEDKWTAGTPLESNFLGMEGLETQAHGGLMAHRMLDVSSSRVATIRKYQLLFRAAFPGDPEPVNRLNVALAIAAYERTLLSDQAPFQRWLRGKRGAMTTAEKRGAILFFGKAGCESCHTGPALNSMSFHALGMDDLDRSYDSGRVNLAPFGGSIPQDTQMGRGGFTGRSDDEYKFKTPQLYNLVDSPFYGHGASFATVREVVEYMNAGTAQNTVVPTTQLAPQFKPLGLTPPEIEDIVAFIENALYDPALDRYVPRSLPSGNCFPVNDPQSRQDLGCETVIAKTARTE